MSVIPRTTLIFMLACGMASQALAQDAPIASIRSTTAEPACELHVWPTDNFTGANTGLLSGFGLVGAIVDDSVHQGRVATVKDLMEEYLTPAVQVSELEKVGILNTLRLTDYKITIHTPTPSFDQAKADPAIKATVKSLNAKLKAGHRLTDSTAPCYGELILTDIFYHKAMMYGSNLFVTTTYRDFSHADGVVRKSAGSVKNPLEHFPPKSPDMIETAKVELIDAFAKNFIEWSQKKLK